jgi:hypothetical protein
LGPHNNAIDDLVHSVKGRTADQTDTSINDAHTNYSKKWNLAAGKHRKGSSKIKKILTLPSYSRRESTSGAMYAGVPTVDLGLECSRDDCDKESLQKKGVSS